MATEPTQAAQESGIALLINWANEQDHWITKLVSEVIETRNKLSNERIGELYDWLCREKKIASDASSVVGMLSPENFGTPIQATMQLISLQHIENVNAIVENEKIEFHERMTICFGENASGKTGYVRILKNAARRTTQASIVDPVLSNINRNQGKEIPRAKLKFLAGGQECEIEWTGEQGVDQLTQIDIFDSQIAVFHLRKDMTYSYTPAELRLFPLVKDGIERVQQKLEIEKSNIQSTLSTHANQFPQESDVSSYFREILTSTNTNKPIKLNFSQVSNEEKAKLPKLRENFAAISSGEVQAQIQQENNEKDIFESTINVANIINKFKREAYTAALSKLRTARQKHKNAMHDALIGEDVPGVLDDVWKEFIKTAEHYIKEIDIAPYPASEEKCIYCRQPLGDAAVKLLNKYRNYCNNALQQEINQSHQEVQSISKIVNELVIEKIRDDIEKLVKKLENTSSPPPNLVAAHDIVKYALELKKVLQQDADCLPLPLNFQRSLEIIKKATNDIETTIVDLSKVGEERREALVTLQQKQQDIEARIKLEQLMPKIDIHVKIVSCLNHFPSIKKSLTNVAKKASETLINRNFTERFNQECKALSAPPVKLDFPGREGEIRKRKTLMAGDYNLAEILSEGEQKVIALADFLADVSLKPNRSPVVFDDPVTSLDYKRLRHVVTRLFELSQERQVIVFTHDIWFARDLVERFGGKYKENLLINKIEAEGLRFGIVTQKRKLEIDNFKNRKNKISIILKQANEEKNEEQRLDLVRLGYTHLRGACEVITEQDIFKDMIARYRPNIRMTGLEEIKVERLSEAIKIIMEVFDKCSRITEGHSHPLPTSEARPCLQELIQDLDKIQKARDEYNREN